MKINGNWQLKIGGMMTAGKHTDMQIHTDWSLYAKVEQ